MTCILSLEIWLTNFSCFYMMHQAGSDAADFSALFALDSGRQPG
jgi:hypothetical protein